MICGHQTREAQAAKARELVKDALHQLNAATAGIEGALATLGEAIVAWPLLAHYHDMAGAEERKGQIETEATLLVELLANQEAWQDGPIQERNTQ